MTDFFKNLKNNKYLFIINLTYFIIGFINVHYALLGLICMLLPFVLLVKNNRKTYCQGYCPRANLYSKAGKLTSKYSRKTPLYFISGNMKYIMLIYFGISLFFITMSTIKVGRGAMIPLEQLRFFIVFPIPYKLPQLFSLNNMVPWITHLSYRFYSMMMTTTIIGLVMAFIYKPRTWCTICPISTISSIYLKNN